MNNPYDVIVVGSGAGGGACVWSLVEQGLTVCLLEAGPEYNYLTDYGLHRTDWEQQLFPDKQGASKRQSYAEMQLLDNKWSDLQSWNHKSGNLNTSQRRSAFAYHHVRGLGGSTLHYTGEAHRLNPLAMNLKSEFDVAADWPLSYRELEPYYQTAETLVGVAGRQNHRCPRSKPYPLPPHALNYNSQYLANGFKFHGMSLEPNSLAILSKPYDGRPACNHCNNCLRGCPRADKGSIDVTYIRKARNSKRCTILTECSVSQIQSTEHDTVTAVQYFDKNGHQHSLKARAIVVACGAVETPRLLLNSQVKGGQSLANESGEIGKHFMETSFWLSNALHPEPLGSHRGIPSDSICWDFNAPDAIDGVIGGCRFSSGVAEANLVGPVNYAKRVVQGWGLEHKKAMREQFGRVISLGAVGESLPNPHSYIDLHPAENDQYGLPRARIHSYLDDMELQRLKFMAKTTRDVLMASGAEKIIEEYSYYDFFSATHVFGTCRMGTDPETSVVDRFGQSHRWRNLFIADASVFPSSGGGEAPSLTIQALALRTADRIVELFKKKQI